MADLPKVGDDLIHPEYGVGKVTAVERGQIYVGKFHGLERTSVYFGESLKKVVRIGPGLFKVMSDQEREAFEDAQRVIATKQAEEAWFREEQQKLKFRVLQHFESGELGLADALYQASCKAWWTLSDYLAERGSISFAKQFVELYKRSTLAELDRFYFSQFSTQLVPNEFAELKRARVARILSGLGQELDDEQELACARPEARVLVRARAGSGKTRTLCAKAALSIVDEQLDPNQVLIVAFNKSAAQEVNKRIQNEFGLPLFRNARTFHSLAFQLAKSKKELLFDEGQHPSARAQSKFVQNLLERIMNPAFKQLLYQFFRMELQEIERIGRDLSPQDYNLFRRSLEHVSLGGDRVKSNGEKYIADFLFEHGIPYRYEKTWGWNEIEQGQPYSPDFSIFTNGQDFILEHWALDPLDLTAILPDEWGITTEEYRLQIEQKRELWKGKKIRLLETHYREINGNRDAFESILKERLQDAGIDCQRLSEEEIISRVFKNDFHISRMAELFLQFIQRAKKRCLSIDQVSNLIASAHEEDERKQLFYQLALRVYQEYQSELAAREAIDFDDLLQMATQEIIQKGGAASIHLGSGEFIGINQIRWLLVDEYQDFTELNYRMLSAILYANPNIRLMAVGDDWQAINGFAGAELRFFYDFAKYFPGAGEVTIATNYRSDASVIDSGNRLMQGLGPAARQREDAGAGEIRQIEVSSVWLEFRGGQQYEENRMRDSIFLPDIPDGKAPTIPQQKIAKVLKTAAVLYKQSSFKSLLLVSRTKRAYGLELDAFRARLIDVIVYLYGEDTDAVRKKIRLMTAHTSKGQEADSVLVLDANERNFPKIHPDNLLYEIFGVTPAEVLSEEKRLFYVAISRAFHRLWIMTDKKEKSQYLQDIGRDENDLASKHPLEINTSEKAHRSLVYKRIVKMLAQ